MFGLVYAIILSGIVYMFTKSRDNYSQSRNICIVYSLILLFFALFMFVTRVHERHFLPVLVFLSIFAFLSKKYLYMYIFLSIFYISDMIFAFYYDYVSLYFQYIAVFVLSALGVYAILIRDLFVNCIFMQSQSKNL